MATHAASTRNLSGLARALAQHGLLSEYDAEALHSQAQAAGITFVEQLLTNKRMSSSQLATFGSRAFGVPLLDLAAFDLDQIQKDLIDIKIAQSRRVLPLHKRGNRLYVATSDPANLQALEEVRFKTNLVVEPLVVEDDKLAQAIHKLIEATGATLKDVASMDDLEVDMQEGTPIVSDEENAEVEDAPVVKYIQKILLDAISAGASDVHFEPYEKFFRIRYRVDGILMEIAQPPLAIKDKVASRIKVISRLDISEKRVPQDGRMKLVLSKTKSIDFRVSTLPTLYGEKIVMRILDSAGVKLGIEALGYDPDQQALLLHAIGRPYGMILVTGPTGSRQDGVAVHLPQHPEPARRQHRDGGGPGGNPAARRQPGQRQREGRPHLRRRPPLVPAAGSGHHDGRRNPRPRDRRHRDQGGADGAPRAVDAAHQRRADDADPAAQHGRRAVQRRLVGDPDHGAAARPQALPAVQAARGHSARGAAARRIQRGGPRRHLAAVRADRLRPLQGHRIQGSGRASTRSCRSATTCAC